MKKKIAKNIGIVGAVLIGVTAVKGFMKKRKNQEEQYTDITNLDSTKKQNADTLSVKNDNLAMPEIIVNEDDNPDELEESQDSIDFSGAMPEIHIKHKDNN